MDNSAIQPLMVAFAVIQLLWTLILLFVGFVLKGIRDDLRENAKSLIELAQKLASFELESQKTFVTKSEAEPRWKRMHDLANDVIGLKYAEQQRSGGADD